MPTTKKRMGRPPKKAQAGQRVALGLRVTSEVKEMLDYEARRTGRTQSQEAELRLERSFKDRELVAEVMSARYGSWLAGILMTAAETMNYVGLFQFIQARRKDIEANECRLLPYSWLKEPFAYNEAVKAARGVFAAFRPPGETARLDAEANADEMRHLAANLAQAMIEELGDLARRTKQGDEPLPYELMRAREVEQIRTMLGPILDRLKEPGLKERIRAELADGDEE